MEQNAFNEDGQNVINHKHICDQPGESSALSLANMQKPVIAGSHHLDSTIAAVTPQKTSEPLLTTKKHDEEAAALPEKYRVLSEFFNRMTCSLRLLGLRKRSPTFQNISRQVEILTGRKFLYRYLAQMKYILPEAVQIDKILIHDQKTLCMKLDVTITLSYDVVKDHHELSTFTALQKLFASRVLNFFTSHPEGSEIPEATLPEIFSQRSDTMTTDMLSIDSLEAPQQSSVETNILLNSRHLCASFSRHFSQETDIVETEKIDHVAPLLAPSISDCVPNEDVGSGEEENSIRVCSKSDLIVNPVDERCSKQSVSSAACGSTPLKLAVEADSLFVETPALSTPKRSVPSCDNKLKVMSSQKLASCNMSAKRSLDFSHLEGEEVALNSSSDETESCKSVHVTISQTTEKERTSLEENVNCSAVLIQKEGWMKQSGSVLLHQTSACLFDVAALIHHLLQSVNCFSITREELIHKIIMNNWDIVERREVEEQIELLEKTVPDWICRKVAPSGDVLYNIKKLSDLNSVRERLTGL